MKAIDQESGKWKRGFRAERTWKLQVNYTEAAINKVVAEHFAGATSRERDFIGERITKEAVAPDLHYDYPFSELLLDGLKGVRKRCRNQRIRRFFKHTWTVVKALVAVVIVTGVFAKLQTDFEIIVVSLRLLAYTGLMRWGWNSAMAGADFKVL